MVIKDSILKKAGILYLGLPFMFFVLTWIKLSYGAILSICFIILVRQAFSQIDKENSRTIHIKRKTIYVIILFLFLWCILGGIGGLYYQSNDHQYRNAIFRDLINYEWPVVYDSGKFLTYYIGQWLVPATIGKVLLFISGNAILAFNIANIFLLIWSSLGVLLTYLLIVMYLKKEVLKDLIIILIIFIFFSGCDVLGVLFKNIDFSMHIEPWFAYCQYSSNTTQLFWVFNQAIPVWIGIMLLIYDQNIKKDLFIGVILLLFSPLPLIGCVLICAAKFIYIFYKIYKWNIHSIFREIITIPNVGAVLLYLPIMVTYLLSNSKSGVGGKGFNLNIGEINVYNIIMLLAFMFFEFGIYLLFTYKRNKNNYLYYIALLCLPIICMFRIGNVNDFEMRASIPLLFIVMIMVMNEVCLQLKYKNGIISLHSKSVFLCLFLALGSITPMIEMYRGYYFVREAKKINLVADEVQTIEPNNKYFIAPYEESAFYKIFNK